MTTHPADPFAAVTHADPYPYYAALATRGLHRNEALGLWVAAGADAVRAVLESDALGVRPLDEPVPRALLGTSAGRLFARLARMTDGTAHAERRERAVRTIAQISDAISSHAETQSTQRNISASLRRCVSDVHQLAVRRIASALGVPADRLDDVAAWTTALVRGIAPNAPASAIDEASRAVDALVEIVPPHGDVANAIGLLVQAHDAMAGLVGNALVARGREAHAESGDALVRHVLRDDPPVHNTRRFVHRDVTLLDQPLRAGDTVLVVLATAGCPFGHGRHACPGQSLATRIAADAIDALRDSRDAIDEPIVYDALPNARVPHLA